tara:strand:- start:138 stop:356 length:219 start_codon:yes stop_codon:yes gene_type:complete
MSALANKKNNLAVQCLVAVIYLLRFMPFSASFYRLNDYLSLVAASCIGATMSTFFGANASIYSSLSPLIAVI